MADGRMVLWVRKHYVGLNAAMAVLWLAVAAIEIIPLVNGDSGTNGGHVFALVLSVLLAILAGVSAVVAFTLKRTKSPKRSSQRVDQ